MKRLRIVSISIILAIGIVLGMVVSVGGIPALPSVAAFAKEPDAKKAAAAPSVAEEIEQIKGKLPGQAHAMMDVAYHFDNLWFAGQRGNWPLAEFYFNETRSHLRWAVRIIPVRKDNQGREIKLAEILQAVENGPVKQLETAIKANDREKFVTAYEFTLSGCYSCHKAADKPYLTLRIPDHPAEAMIDFNPLAAMIPPTIPKVTDAEPK